MKNETKCEAKYETKYEAKECERKMKRTTDAAKHGTAHQQWLPWLCVPLGSVQLRWQVPDFGIWIMMIFPVMASSDALVAKYTDEEENG